MSWIRRSDAATMITKREGQAERDAMERRDRALKALLASRRRRLRESLDQRIRRAGSTGGPALTHDQWQRLHRQELTRLRGQIAELQTEQAQVRRGLSRLDRAVRRSDRLRAASREMARSRNVGGSRRGRR